MHSPAVRFTRVLALTAGLAGGGVVLGLPSAGWPVMAAAAAASMLAAIVLFVVPAASGRRASPALAGAAPGSPPAAGSAAADPADGPVLAPGEFIERRQSMSAAGWGTTLLIAVRRADAPAGADSEGATDDLRAGVVAAIRSNIRPGDLVGLLEGDTFAVFLRAAPQQMSKAIGERICARIEDTIFLDSAARLVVLSASIGGVTTTPASVHREFDMARESLASAIERGPGTVRISIAA